MTSIRRSNLPANSSRLASEIEVNFDGLVGPTHNYAGLSFGNRASMANLGETSNPKAAALQGLAKMRLMVSLGVPQGILPPQQRPDPATLDKLGFGGFTSALALAKISERVPRLVPSVMSASAMWTANSATVTPSADTSDGRVHFTVANLISVTHRSFEPDQTAAILAKVFPDPGRFAVHRHLASTAAFSDEGAANHSRFVGASSAHLFVYSREHDEPQSSDGFPRRHSKLASQLIAGSHGLPPDSVVYARQSKAAIDAGAFHNDVVAVANRDVLFTHAEAIDDAPAVYERLSSYIGSPLAIVEVSADEMSLDDAVDSYVFNSQLVSVGDETHLVAPESARLNPRCAAYLENLTNGSNPVDRIHFVDVGESMRNGGGPACLRLRVSLQPNEIKAVRGKSILDESTIDQLEQWVHDHYRDELHPRDLSDPALAYESMRALDELTTLLELGADVYPFQQG